MTDRILPFADLPWSKVTFEPSSGWSWGRGGCGLDDLTYHIDFTDTDLNTDIYPLPFALSQMLKSQLQHGSDNKLSEIRRALEL